VTGCGLSDWAFICLVTGCGLNDWCLISIVTAFGIHDWGLISIVTAFGIHDWGLISIVTICGIHDSSLISILTCGVDDRGLMPNRGRTFRFTLSLAASYPTNTARSVWSWPWVKPGS